MICFPSFLSFLHTEIERAWKNPYVTRIRRHQQANYADAEAVRELGYMPMPFRQDVGDLTAVKVSTERSALPLYGSTYMAAGHAAL